MSDYDDYIDNLMAQLRQTAEGLVESTKHLEDSVERLTAWQKELEL
jgi:hypothetical protein